MYQSKRLIHWDEALYSRGSTQFSRALGTTFVYFSNLVLNEILKCFNIMVGSHNNHSKSSILLYI